AALAALVLGNERLVLVETLGDLRLAQSVVLAQLKQLRAEHDLARRAQGVAHGERPGSKTVASRHNPDSGLSHFGIGHVRRNRGPSCWFVDRKGGQAMSESVEVSPFFERGETGHDGFPA